MKRGGGLKSGLCGARPCPVTLRLLPPMFLSASRDDATIGQGYSPSVTHPITTAPIMSCRERDARKHRKRETWRQAAWIVSIVVDQMDQSDEVFTPHLLAILTHPRNIQKPFSTTSQQQHRGTDKQSGDPRPVSPAAVSKALWLVW